MYQYAVENETTCNNKIAITCKNYDITAIVSTRHDLAVSTIV